MHSRAQWFFARERTHLIMLTEHQIFDSVVNFAQLYCKRFSGSFLPLSSN
jgi:hypothetical protein